MKWGRRRATLGKHMIRKCWCNTVISEWSKFGLRHRMERMRGTLENIVENQRGEGLGKEEGASGRSGMLGKNV